MVLNFGLLGPLLAFQLFLADLNAATCQESECLHDVRVLAFDTVRHLATVDEQSCQSENEALNFKVVLDVRNLLEHELEEGVHGPLLVKHADCLAHVVPQAHCHALQKHNLIVRRLRFLQFIELELQNTLDNVRAALNVFQDAIEQCDNSECPDLVFFVTSDIETLLAQA